jgi:hypothetical protein
MGMMVNLFCGWGSGVPSFACVDFLSSLHGVHALHAVYATFAHGFTAANVGASESTPRLEKQLYA